ncbi:MAG TPA: SDR family NAD(P)-dependent oxidoreductase [Caulobacteraceae bacterium]|nr:SDR family NAD(P)-dependent oxidoreductase [Caulobacteraceae bacterium]
MNFEGRTAWVTGASSGIGEALAIGLGERGARVILSGRRVEALETLASAMAGESLVLPFETTDLDALPAVVDRAIGWREGVDLLINNAGVSQRSLALDTEFDVYRTIMEIDYFAPVRLTQLVLPHMVERGSGHLAVVSSVAGKVGVPLRTGYCSAKHAVVGYFDALRAEIETAYGVGVSVITPGSVATQVAHNALSGSGARHGQADPNIDNGIPVGDAAQIILDGIAAGKREIPVASGGELGLLELRAKDAEAAFAATAAIGARLAAARAARP